MSRRDNYLVITKDWIGRSAIVKMDFDIQHGADDTPAYTESGLRIYDLPDDQLISKFELKVNTEYNDNRTIYIPKGSKVSFKEPDEYNSESTVLLVYNNVVFGLYGDPDDDVSDLFELCDK